MQNPKCATLTRRWPDASRTSVHFTFGWADHSFWSRSEIRPNICKKRGRVHQFGTAVRQVKEGTSSVFVQSGPQQRWCAEALEWYCYLRNLQDLPADGRTPNVGSIHRAIGRSFPLEQRQNAALYLQTTKVACISWHTSPSWNFHGIRPERREMLDW